MSDSVRPHRRKPTRLSCPWDSPGKNTGVGFHFLLQCMKSEKWKWSRSVMSDSHRPHGPQAHQAPPSMGFSRQEYWSGVPSTGHSKYPLPTTQEITLYVDITRLIIFFAAEDGEPLYTQQKQDLELTVSQIISSLLQNSGLNWRK